jgi:Ca2+-binding EF-hand superfamily protein
MEDTFRPLKIQITDEMVRWNFSQIDKDNSGRISFDEYMQFIKKYN